MTRTLKVAESALAVGLLAGVLLCCSGTPSNACVTTNVGGAGGDTSCATAGGVVSTGGTVATGGVGNAADAQSLRLNVTTDPPPGTALTKGSQQTMVFTISYSGLVEGSSVTVQPICAVSGDASGQYTVTAPGQALALAQVQDSQGTVTATVVVTPPNTGVSCDWIIMSFWVMSPGSVIPVPVNATDTEQWLVFPVKT